MKHIKLFETHTIDSTIKEYLHLFESKPIMFDIVRKSAGTILDYNDGELILDTHLDKLFINGHVVSVIDKTNMLLLKAEMQIQLSKITKICKYFDIKRKELEERFEEFEVVKNNKIDMISLNSLFDFYDKYFDEELINKVFN